MSEDLPNIFDESARGSGKSGDKKHHKKKRRPVEGSGEKASDQTPLERSEKGTDEQDVRSMLDRIQKMHEELEEKLDDIDNISTYLPQQLKDILEHPETVDQEYLAKLVKTQEEMEEKVGAILGVVPHSLRERKDEKKEKKRGQKSAKLRARKNWMRME